MVPPGVNGVEDKDVSEPKIQREAMATDGAEVEGHAPNLGGGRGGHNPHEFGAKPDETQEGDSEVEGHAPKLGGRQEQGIW